MRSLRQPGLGIVASVLIMVISLVFISFFSWPTFSGWVSTSLMCAIPIAIVVGAFWHSEYPKSIAAQRQPVRGLLFLVLAAVVAGIVVVVALNTVGGGVSPPLPILVHFIIVSVVVAFTWTIMWGGWPFSLIPNKVLDGFSLLVAIYLLNYGLFRLLFNYDFLAPAPIYRAELDPGGMFDAWDATVFYVTFLAIMFLLLHFDLWPLNKSAKLMRQPVLGVVWTLIALVLGGALFWVGTRVLDVAAPVFLVWVPIPFIFGSILFLNMMGGSVFARFTQPLKGVLSAVAALVVGVVLALGYAALAPVVTESLASGLPTFDFEVWLASALLAVTFPFLAFYGDFFQLWPLNRPDRTAPPEQSAQEPPLQEQSPRNETAAGT